MLHVKPMHEEINTQIVLFDQVDTLAKDSFPKLPQAYLAEFFNAMDPKPCEVFAITNSSQN